MIVKIDGYLLWLTNWKIKVVKLSLSIPWHAGTVG